MRKGQQALVRQAIHRKYGDMFVKVISESNLVLKKLSYLCSCMYPFKDDVVDEEWMRAFLSVTLDRMLFVLSNYRIRKGTCVSIEEMFHFTSESSLIAWLSEKYVPINNLTEAEFVINHLNNPILDICIRIIHKQRIVEGLGMAMLLQEIYPLEQAVRFFGRSSLPNLDMEKLSDAELRFAYAREVSNAVFLQNTFCLHDTDNIPDDIKHIDTKGYGCSVSFEGGRQRVCHVESDALWINVYHFGHVWIDRDGNCRPSHKQLSEKLMFSSETKTFMYAFQLRRVWKYVPAALRDIFRIISIGNTEQDKNEAQGIVEFLCRHYNTYIFRDLYSDYLASNGLFFTISAEEAGKYHTRQELFREFYHFDMAGNWNKKNVNLTYSIMKLRSRLTNQALSRAMACKNAPQVFKVGNARWKLAVFFLFCAVYAYDASFMISNHCNDMELFIRDALQEEYKAKIICLHPVRRTINEHNRRNMNTVYHRDSINVQIRKDTKFRYLIDHMPSEYELIDSSDRLYEESLCQHHCVAAYDRYITNDESMIYSTVVEKKRYTIEIKRGFGGNYYINQFRGACNVTPKSDLISNLAVIIDKINAERRLESSI